MRKILNAGLILGIFAMCIASLIAEEDNTVSGKIGEWATITVPKTVKPGQSFKVKIKLGDVKEGMKISSDLHFKKADGSYGGFAASFGSKEAKANSEVVFTVTAPNKPGAAKFLPLFYLSTAGNWQTKTESGHGPEIEVIQ